jgi:hypothetical protein
VRCRKIANGERVKQLGQTTVGPGQVRPDLAEAQLTLAVQSDSEAVPAEVVPPAQTEMDAVSAEVAAGQAELAVLSEMQAVTAEVAAVQAELAPHTKMARVQAELMANVHPGVAPVQAQLMANIQPGVAPVQAQLMANVQPWVVPVQAELMANVQPGVAAVQAELAVRSTIEVMATFVASSTTSVGQMRKPGGYQGEQRREQRWEPNSSQREQWRNANARLPMCARCPPRFPVPVHCRLQQISHSPSVPCV